MRVRACMHVFVCPSPPITCRYCKLSGTCRHSHCWHTEVDVKIDVYTEQKLGLGDCLSLDDRLFGCRESGFFGRGRGLFCVRCFQGCCFQGCCPRVVFSNILSPSTACGASWAAEGAEAFTSAWRGSATGDVFDVADCGHGRLMVCLMKTE